MKCIQADYVKFFQCDGKICGSRCCRDWSIPIDDETLQKYLRSEKIMQSVENSAAENFAVIKLTEQGKCSFLDEDFLCRLQKNYGEDFLTAICASYPRVTYKLTEKIFQQSMTLTCPVAAQKILFREEPITFETVDFDNARMFVDFSDRILKPAEKFLEVQSSAIKILQDRNFSINRRLKNLCELFGMKNFSDFNAEGHAEKLAEIFIEMYGAKIDAQGKKILGRNYLNTYKKLFAQMEENFSFILENYLVNEFFMRCYPCAFKDDEITNCKIFVTGFKVLEFALVLTAIADKNLTGKEFLNLVCAVNDKLDHSKGGMSAIVNFALSCEEEIFSALMLEED